MSKKFLIQKILFNKKQFWSKKICPKKFLVKIALSQKIFCPKRFFRPKKFLVQKHFWFLVRRKLLGPKFFFGSKKRNVWSKIFFCLIKYFNKFFFFFFSKKFVQKNVQNLSSQKHLLCLDNFGMKNFWSKKNVGLQIFSCDEQLKK